MTDNYMETAQNQEVDQQIGQIDYNIENLSENNTGKTESGGSNNEGELNNQFHTVALDDMEDDGYQEYKVHVEAINHKDDLTKDLAEASAQKNHGYRDRLYSTSGVIIEGPVIKQKKKSIDQNALPSNKKK